jgi:tRNA dimethylallyltransferase
LELLGQLFINHDVVIMTGGSGLYINAVTEGLDEMPEVDKDIRKMLNKLFKEEGLKVLQAKLAEVDPDYYQTVDLNNPQRLIRALEVGYGTGRPYSSYRVKSRTERPFQAIKIALYRDRNELYERIDARMDDMITKGLFEEAAALYPFRYLNALQTVGYREIFDYMDGLYDREEAIRLLKRNSRRYAKRQLTWLRKDETYTWFHPAEQERIFDFITHQMAL